MKGFDFMRPFSDLTQEFSNWIDSNNIKFSQEEHIKYIWQLPVSAINQWKTELDDYRDLFSDEVYQTFVNQFEDKGAVLGIYNVARDNSSIAKLYKLSSYYREFTIEDILVSRDFQLPIESNLVTLPNGSQINLPTSIEHGSIKLFYPDKSNPFNLSNSIDLSDSILKDVSKGSLVGYGFSIGSREHNRLNSNSFLATVNYQSGILHIIRNNNLNEKKFVDYYNLAKSGGSRSSSSGSSSSSSMITPYDYISVSGSFCTLGNPVSLVFSFDCNDKIESIEDEQYNNLTSYSNNQSLIIKKIKEDLDNSILEQQKIIQEYSNNYDFLLGKRN